MQSCVDSNPFKGKKGQLNAVERAEQGGGGGGGVVVVVVVVVVVETSRACNSVPNVKRGETRYDTRINAPRYVLKDAAQVTAGMCDHAGVVRWGRIGMGF